MAVDLNALLALAQPDPEYCFFWIDSWPTCMKKAEWAGWVQAVGSVAAIVGIWWQVRQQRLEVERQPLKQERAALLEAVDLLTTARISTEYLAAAATDVYSYLKALQDNDKPFTHQRLISLLDQFEVGRLTAAESKVAFLAGRAAFHHMLNVREDGVHQKPSMNAFIVKSQADAYRGNLKNFNTQLEILRKRQEQLESGLRRLGWRES